MKSDEDVSLLSDGDEGSSTYGSKSRAKTKSTFSVSSAPSQTQSKRDRVESLTHHEKQSHWLHSGLIIVGEIIGTGVLALPEVVATLGWVLGITSIFFFALCSMYAGILVSRVRTMLAEKSIEPVEVVSYAQAAERIDGKIFGKITEWAIITNWAMCLPYFLMASTNGLVLGLYFWEGTCYYGLAAIVMLVLLPLLQIQTLHVLSKLAGASTAAVAIVIFAVLIDIAYTSTVGKYDDNSPDGFVVAVNQSANGSAAFNHTFATTTAPVHDLWPRADGLLPCVQALASATFAFQGQSMFLEIMAEMKSPKDFPKSLYFSTAFMTAVYTITCVVAYGFRGRLVPSFIPAAVPKGWISALVELLLFFHILVSYLLTAQPLTFQTRVMLSKVKCFQNICSQDKARGKCFGAMLWLIVTGGYLCFAYLVANLIPFFAVFQAIIGSALGAPVMFFWPPFMFLRLTHKLGAPLACADRLMCYLLLFVLLPVVGGAGLYAAFHQLISDWATFGYPFACRPVGY